MGELGGGEHRVYPGAGSWDEVGYEVVSPDPVEIDDEGTSCFFCEPSGPATTAFPLDPAKLMVSGRGFTLGGPLTACDRCAQMFVDGSDAELLQTQRELEAERWWRIDRSPMVGAEADTWDEHAVATLRALHAAAGEPFRLRKHAQDPRVVGWRAEGFELLDEWTGMTDELGEAWPTKHSRVLPDQGHGVRSGEKRWFVRSPWPSLALDRVLEIVFTHVDDSGSAGVRTTRMAEVLNWSESRARSV